MYDCELDASEEGDFIAMYNNKQALFGLFIRIKKGELAHILKNQLKKNAISLNDIEQQTEEDVAGTVKSYSYFLCTNKTLIYMPGGLSIKSFETYLSWLLNNNKCAYKYIFNPIITKKSEIPLSEISEIIISDSLFYKMDADKIITKSLDFQKIKKDTLKALLKNSSDLDEIDAENIISAKIQLKIKSKSVDKEKQLTALVKSVDNDDIRIKDKQGRTIKGSEYHEKKVCSIETTRGGFPVEEQIKQKMEEFLQGLS